MEDKKPEPLAMDGAGDKYNLLPDGGAAEDGPGVSQMEVSEGANSKPSPKVEGLAIIVISFIVFAVAVTIALIVTIYCAPPMIPPHGAVNSQDDQCSKIGVNTLKDGGSAVDAAISTALCLTVTQPHVASLGGGGLLLEFEAKTNDTYGLDFTESVPNTASVTNPQGADAIATPGALQGLKAAYDEHGIHQWKDLFAGAINLARNGFKITSSLADAMANQSFCDVDSALRDVLCDANNNPLSEGDTATNPAYADLLDQLAAGDFTPFYDTIMTATSIVADPESYQPSPRSVSSVTFQGTTVLTLPEASAGPGLQVMMEILNRYTDWSKASEQLYYHRITEVIKLQGDIEAGLLNKSITLTGLATSLKGLLQDDAVYAPTNPVPVGRPCSHMTVVSADEAYVSLTISLGSAFGSGVATQAGFLLNDQLAYYPVISGLTTPYYLSTPAILRSNSACGLRAALAAENIPELLQVISNIFIRKLGETVAVTAPRVAINPTDFSVMYDPGLSKTVLDKMQQTMTAVTPPGVDGGVSMVGKNNETIFVSSDPRGGLVSEQF